MASSTPSPPPRAEPALLAAVEYLAQGHAPLLSPATARAAAAQALAGLRPGEASLEALRGLLGAAGMDAVPGGGALGRLAEQGEGARWVAAAAGRLFGVEAGAGGVVALGPLGEGGAPRRLGVAEAEALLGLSAGQELALLGALPALPLAGAVEGHGHGHVAPLRRLWALLRAEERDLWVVVIFAVGYGLLSLAMPAAVQALVNTVAFGSLVQPVVVLTSLLAVALGLGALLRTLQAWVVEQVQQRLMVRLALDLGGRLPRVEEAALEGGAGQELVNRFFDVLTLQKSVATFLTEGVLLVLQASMGLLLLAFYHPALLAFDVVLLVLGVGVLGWLGRGGTASAISESREKYALVAWLEELARVPAAFKGPGGASWARLQVEERVRAWLHARRGHHRVAFRQLVGAYALQAVAATALLGLGGLLVIERQLTLGQLVAAEFVVTSVLTSLTRLGKQFEGWYDALAAADKLGHLLELPLEARRPGLALPGSGPLAVELPGGLSVAPGGTLAVVGPAGTGKSQLARALAAQSLPGQGRAQLSGRDVAHLDADAVRAAAALVRGVECFRAPLVDNVAAGRPGVTREEAWRALEEVGLLGVVQGLPEADLTPLSASGAPLTRGQARRLMFARALAGRPRLLVVDDALDDVEPELREALARVLAPGGGAPWTLVVFAQEEDALVRRCDRVVRWDGRAP